MEPNRTSRGLSKTALIVSFYLAAVPLVILLMSRRSPGWRLFVNDNLGQLPLRLSFACGLGGVLLWGRPMLLRTAKTDAFRCGLLLLVVAAGFNFKLRGLEFAAAIYAAYAVLFAGRPLQQIPFLNSARRMTDRLLDGFLDVDGRTPALLALLLLFSSVVLFTLDSGPKAESAAVYAYFLLILAVVLQALEMRMGIEKENPFLALLRSMPRAAAGQARRMMAWTRDREPLVKRAAVYLFGLGVILGSFAAAKRGFWERVQEAVAGNVGYKSEIRLLGDASGEFVFPSYDEALIVPVRVRHPLSHPLLWPTSGRDAVSVGIQWFPERNSGGTREKLFEEYLPLPQPLFVNEHADVRLKLRRPLIPTGKVYEVWIGLVSDGRWWARAKRDGVMKIRVRVEELGGENSFAHEKRIFEALAKKKQEIWSARLSSVPNGYRSKMAMARDSLYTDGRMTVDVTNIGAVPWPVGNERPVRLGVVWLRKSQGKGGYVHLAEEKFDLPKEVFPGNNVILEISFDPFKVPDADEIWIGMVHDGKTWFYKQGDPVLKVERKETDKRVLLSRRTAFVRAENTRLLKEMGAALSWTDELWDIESSDYRSKIQMLNYDSNNVTMPDSSGLSLDLKITNMGDFPWKPDGRNPVKLGVLWFKKSPRKLDYTMRVLEERFHFPLTMLKDTTVQLPCKIGGGLKRGVYEAWIGPVQEGVVWFYEQGDEALKLNVTVK